MTEPTPEPSATSAKLMNPIVFVCKDSVADYRCDLDGQECLVFPFHPANNSTTTNLALEYKSCNIAKHVLTSSQRALIMLKIRIRQQDRALIPLIESITGFEDLAKLVGARNIDPQYYDDLKQQIFARCELGAPSVNAVGFDEGWKQSKTPPNPVAIPLTLMPSYKYPTKYFKYVNFIQSLREAYEKNELENIRRGLRNPKILEHGSSSEFGGVQLLDPRLSLGLRGLEMTITTNPPNVLSFHGKEMTAKRLMQNQRRPVHRPTRWWNLDNIDAEYGLPDEENCCLFIKGIPANADYFDVFDSIKTGAVVFLSLKDPEPEKLFVHQAATLVFMDPEAAMEYYLASRDQDVGVKILDKFITVNFSHRGRRRSYLDRSMAVSRCLEIEGPPELMTEEFWKEYFKKAANVDDSHYQYIVANEPKYTGLARLEVAFPSIETHARHCFNAIKADPEFHGKVRARFVADPCDPAYAWVRA